MPRHILLAVPLFACALAHAEPPAEKIVERYRQMLAANPVEGTALDRLWQASTEQGKTAELLAEYEGGKTFASEMVFGHLLRKALRPVEAAAAYQRAAALDASSPLPFLALAQLEKGEGRHAEAAKRLGQAIELLPKDDPRLSDTLMELGGEWFAAGNPEAAAAAWEQTAALDPQNLDLHRRLADSYVRQHLGERAIPHLDFIVEHAPASDRAQALQQLAGIQQTSGHQDAAIAALERALACTGPESWLRADLQSQLIRLHQRYHRTPELEQRWKKFAAENPRDLGAYLQLIELYERLGDHPQELAWLEKLVALAPKNADYRTRLARLLVQMDQLVRAAKIYDELIAAQRGNIDLVFERARLDLQRDQPQAAGERIAALVAAQKTDDSVRGKALDFYETNRLFDLAEKQLVEDAKGNAEEPLLALANFYFSRRRDAEARGALGRIARPDAPAEQRAALRFKVAQIFKAQNEIDEAVAAIRAAIDLQPGVREYHFLLGELEAGRAHYPEAQKGFERAVALSRTPAEAQDADQRLYESLRNQQEPDEEDRHPQPLGAIHVEPNSATSAAAQGYLLKMLRAAVEQPNVEGWLRVARWQMWSRNTRGALDAADHALALDAGSVAAHEFLAKLHSADPQTPATEQHLRELIRLDPANRHDYLRRIGQAALQAGRTDDALRVFAEAIEASPGNPDALMDLALAQQRAEHWDDALVTLKKVYVLAPASSRREVVNALLRVEDHLGMKQAAAELLLAQIDADGADAKDRAGYFQELLARCTRDGLLDWLHTQFDRRRKFSAGDYFTEMAFGRILKAQGNKAAAFEVLADAAVSAPNPAESLPELVHEAEDLRKLDAAITLQTQLVQIVAQNGPEGFERLAQLQEKNLQPDDAAQTWERIVAKFPRDLGVLEDGVEFQRKWGTPPRALDWLRRIRVLDPANVRALSQLAALALEAGKSAEAEVALEEILAHTDAEKPDEPVHFPGVKPDDSSRLQTAYLTTVRQRRGKPTVEAMRALRGFWLEETPTSAPGGERELRQRAIRDLGQLIAAKGDAAELAKWAARWRAKGVAPGEKLLALYAANASGPLLEEVAALLAAKPGDAQTTNAFIWLALQTGEFDRLAAWLQDRQRTSAERDYLMVALDRYLDGHAGQLDPSLIERIFPPSSRQRLWQTAVKFGQRGHFREATELGQRVFDGLTTQRATFGVDLANWYLDLGEIDRARAVLRASVVNIGESFDAPVYTALRALYRLLPESERADFADDYRRTLDEQAHPLHTAIARTVLASLQGDEKTARAELQRVIDLRVIAPTVTAERPQDRVFSAERSWIFILGAGLQLQAWHDDALAQYLWERALADSAWISLQAQTQGDKVRQRVLDVRVQLAAVKLAHAEPFEFDEVLAEFTRGTPPETVDRVAEELESAGANPRAIEIRRRIWEREPGAPRALGDLINACRGGEDFTTLEEVLAKAAADSAFRASDPLQRDLILQLADLFEHRKDFESARRILAKGIEAAPSDTRFGLRLAQLHEQAGQSASAEAAYRRVLAVEPGNSTARLALAGLLEAADRVPAALELLEHTTGPDIDARLAQLFAKAGRLDEAVGALERVPLPGHVPAALMTANVLVARGEDREARLVLRGALSRSPDPQMNFPLQERVVELLQPGNDAAAIPREIRLLRQMAAGEPELLSAYFDLIDREAPRLKIEAAYRSELTETWDEGRGLLLAGGALLDWQLHHEAPAAAATWTQLLARPDLDLLTVERAAISFHSAQDGAREIEALGRLARLDATAPTRLIDWARALERGQRHDEAMKVLAELAARAVFQEEVAAPAARACAELGEPARARALFAQAIAADPAARHSDVYLDYARLLMAQKEFNAVPPVLRVAFRNPANREYAVLADWLVASGRTGQADTELPVFGLSPQVLIAVRRAMFDELEKGGQVAAAVKLLDEHAEIFEAGMGVRLRVAAKKAGAYAEAAALFERLIAQSPLEDAEAAGELALLLVDWAEAEAGDADAALAHLKHACDLRPDLWSAAERLSRLYAERNEPKPAAQTLRTFMAASKDAAEVEKARQALAQLPSS